MWIKFNSTYYNLDRITKIEFSTDTFGYERFFVIIDNYKYEVTKQNYIKIQNYVEQKLKENLL